MPYTRAQLRDLIRQRCDLENTTVQQDTELNNHINDATAARHDLFIAMWGEQYLQSLATVPTVAGQSDYSPPADFYKLVALTLTIDDRGYPLAALNPIAGTVLPLNQQAWGPGNLPRYSLRYGSTGITLAMSPAPDASGLSLALRYHPQAPSYTGDTDTVAGPFSDWVILDASIRVKDKEQRDSSYLKAERAEIERRIREWAAPLDELTPFQTVRAPTRYSRAYWRRERIF